MQYCPTCASISLTHSPQRQSSLVPLLHALLMKNASFAANSIDLENSPLSSNPDKEKHEVVTLDGKSRQASSMKKPCKDKPTRVRTVLNEKQLSTLKRCYAANPRPDSVMKEQLVDLTGLSPRVIRVWFQNKRCKDKKKMMLNGGGDGKIGVCMLSLFLTTFSLVPISF